MCGIAGAVGGDARAVDAMLERLAHRGPDERATANGGRARLGCARLDIRGGDIGRQPLRTRRGLLVFNGEIANTKGLLADLAWHGVAVAGDSDTAIVGALLDVYGIAAVDRMNGMYALAWDDGDTVWLARDPAGIKPLYYRSGRFASEIRPLLDGGAALHPSALRRWLAFHVPYGDETLFAGVRRVPPGGIVALPEGRVVRAGHPGHAFGAANPALTPERVRKVLQRAVRDAVPQGERFAVALSGGVDSTLVAALAQAAGGEATAFHGRVAEEGCDESAYARAAAEALGLELIEVPVTAEACLEAWPEVVARLEEPVAGPGSLAQHVVARAVSREFRILLTGCGGDELFGGYARAAALERDEPPPGLEAYAPLFARVAGLAPAERAYALLDRFQPELYGKDFVAAHPPPREEFLDRFAQGGLPPDAAFARAEREITLPALLQVEDRVTMAFSIEGRVPLLDRRLLKIASRLAPRQRVDEAGRLKALLKDAAAPHLPRAVAERHDKMGFPLPLGAWFRGPWRDFAVQVLRDRSTRERGVLDVAVAERALERSGPYDRGLYAAISLELFCRTFLDG